MASRTSAVEKCLLFAFTAFAAATHSATLGGAARTVLRRLDRATVAARDGLPLPDWRRAASPSSPARRCCCRPISRCRDNWPGRPAATASPSDGCCRMASSRAICSDHCPQQKLQALPLSQRAAGHRRRVPVGQQHVQHARPLRGHERRDGLHRAAFAGRISALAGRGRAGRHGAATGPCGDRRRHQRLDSAIPTASSSATSRRSSKPMRAAHQQHWDIDFTAINWIHVPVALASMLLVVAMFGHGAAGAAGSTISRCSPRPSRLALLGNAFICGVISGPHDRYGARMVWIATFVVLIAAIRHFAGDDEPRLLTAGVTGNPARRSCRPCRRPRACGRGWECRAPPRPE